MSADPLVLTADVDRATARLVASAADLDDAAVATPSPLPGWSRGHVLAHLARNADGLVNLLTWARTGVETPQYASVEARNADIEAGAGRPAAEQLADVRDSAARLAEAIAAMPVPAWAARVRTTSGRQLPAAGLVWGRLREVEVHHVDLAAGYSPADWPLAFALRLLREVAEDLSRRDAAPALTLAPTDEGAHPLAVGDGPGVTVTGPASALAAWLTGRSAGEGLRADSAGEGPRAGAAGSLPEVPTWI